LPYLSGQYPAQGSRIPFLLFEARQTFFPVGPIERLACSYYENPLQARNPFLPALRTLAGFANFIRKDHAPMQKNIMLTFALVAVTITSAIAGLNNPVVGGKEMYPTKNIIENAVNSADHTTLVAAVKAAGLVETLEGPGPFTVFAPTNEAFNKLPAGTVDTLLKPENKSLLTKVLTYHVVAGRLSASDLMKMIKEGNGTAELTTVEGGKLWVLLHDGKHIMLKDEKGGMALVTIANVFQSNGVIHVIDNVVMPN
jgi:uncharacterized surface protein with fasciclin (FAS1) repeats